MSRIRPKIFVRDCQYAWLRRTLRLSGAVDALIHYDGRPLRFRSGPDELVYVDQLPVRSSRPAWPARRRIIAFRVQTVMAEIEVELSWIALHAITYFKLTVDGVMLYEEAPSHIAILNPPSVPIPAQAPPANPQTLPIPTDASEGSG